MWANSCLMGPVDSTFKTSWCRKGLKELLAEFMEGASDAARLKQPFFHLAELEWELLSAHVDGLVMEVNRYRRTVLGDLVEGFVGHSDSQKTKVRHVSLKDESKRLGDDAFDTATWMGAH